MAIDSPLAEKSALFVALVAAVGLYVGAVTSSMEHADYNVWGALLVAPALLALSVPLLKRAAARETDHRIARVLLWAFALKMAASMLRYDVAFRLYDGNADARTYDVEGTRISELLRHGVFSIDLGKQFVGTGFTRLLTGIVYTVTGPTQIGGFLVFAWFGYWGAYLFYRAFALALPDGDTLRYAKLVMLLPSLLFWPSSIGKEAFITLAMGVGVFGAARIYVRLRGGYALLVVGLAGTAVVRPHITLILIAAVGIGFLLRPRNTDRSPLGPVYKAIGLAVMAVAVLVALAQAQKFFGVENLGSNSVDDVLTATQGRTDEGGSTFKAMPVNSPQQLPGAILTVLFRPFPNEARNAQMLAASAEGLFLMAVIAKSWRRFAMLPRLLRRRPFVMLATSYILFFVFAFSNFNNFGIMTRQRVQVFPFLFVLLALPLPAALRSEAGARRDRPRRALVPMGRS